MPLWSKEHFAWCPTGLWMW